MRRNGFTLIEIMIVVAITALIGTVVTLNLFGNRTRLDLTDSTKQIATLLRQAQSDSLSEESGTIWGVYFDNTSSTKPSYSLAYQTAFNVVTGVGNGFVKLNTYYLPADICYAASSVTPGTGGAIFFNAVSGSPSATATITLDLMAGGGCPTLITGSSSISAAGSGEIFFDDFNRSTL